MTTKEERKAPKGMFRVIGVDTFSNEDWCNGDYKTKAEAFGEASTKGGTMTKMYVYDDKGVCLFEAGSF